MNANSTAIRAWLRRLASALVDEQALLDALDAGAGDGDHGATMVLAMRHVAAAVDEAPDDIDPADLLRRASRAFAGVGGSIGPLWGMGGLRAAQALAGTIALDVPTLRVALRACIDGIAEIGAAQVGDRTLLDALVPAVHAFADTPDDTAATRGLEAAFDGARSTATLTARRGRAARNPALAAGRVDAGAASIVLAWLAAVEPAHRQRWHTLVRSSPPSV